jgi:acetyl-CoA carboxylase carboxyl transferase subunit alpha
VRAILWRDSSKKVEAAKALKLTAPDLLKARIIDEIIPEPVGGAHADPAAAAQLLDAVMTRVLGAICGLDNETRLQQRYEKFRRMGRLGVDFVDESP